MSKNLVNKRPKKPGAPAMANELIPRGKDPKTGQFITGNKLSRGRPIGSKPKLSEKFISELAKHFSKQGTKAIERVYQDDPAIYLKLIAHLVPHETLARLEISGEMEITTRTEKVVEAYRLMGEDVTEAEIVELIDG